MFVVQKGKPTRYPVPYTYWKKTTRGQGLSYDSTLDEVLAQTKRLDFQAAPVNAEDPTSAWLTARPRAIEAVQKVLGKSDYQAHAGAYTGGANAVYWLEILTERPDGLVIARNVTEGAKREVEPVTVELEPDLIYPLLRGRDVSRWTAQPSLSILMMQDRQTRRGIDESVVQQKYPKVWAYLKRFESVLWLRQSQSVRRLMETGPFYSMFAIGDYTLAPWKVVWREQAAWFTVAVIGSDDDRLVVPDHKLMLVDCRSEDEAHYLGAALNSSAVTLAVWAYAIAIQQTTHILNNVNVPTFDASSPAHQAMSDLSQHAHTLAPAACDGDASAQSQLHEVEDAVDRAAAALWGLTERELEDVRVSLRELKGS